MLGRRAGCQISIRNPDQSIVRYRANGITAVIDGKSDGVGFGFASAANNCWSQRKYLLLLSLYGNRTIDLAFSATHGCAHIELHEIRAAIILRPAHS
jgi:hypothetical protein